MIALPRNPRPMSKAEEKELYREFILATPEDSYLRTVLKDSQSFVFGNIDNDIAWPVYEQARLIDQEIRSATLEYKAIKEKVTAARKELETVQREVRYAKQDHARVLSDTKTFLDKIDDARLATHRAIRELNQ
jgi:hypothetical protein